MTRVEFMKMIGVLTEIDLGDSIVVGVEGVFRRDDTFFIDPYYEGLYQGYMMRLNQNHDELD